MILEFYEFSSPPSFNTFIQNNKLMLIVQLAATYTIVSTFVNVSGILW